ncbi:ribose 5-phosphate isomerase B [Luteitalea sp.]|jgi:ribose 5-phosphate isomerase B|uniref:ribose 5-phosphate isomerase B n=1 Tax=Luteitalea sp. TaxID=2004800 RepID=UPI0025C58CF4|nr:ribose 5-phosphate isomerase B [Luteitalea sp.]
MRVALGADHAGVHLKDAVRSLLESRGIEVQDFGTADETSVDYPDYAARVGRAVAGGEADRGILACGTGLGMAIAANKIDGVRAAPVVDLESAHLSREHNDANVLALGARVTSADMALKIVATFLDTPFAGGRHQRRLDKIAALEHDRHA